MNDLGKNSDEIDNKIKCRLYKKELKKITKKDNYIWFCSFQNNEDYDTPKDTQTKIDILKQILREKCNG